MKAWNKLMTNQSALHLAGRPVGPAYPTLVIAEIAA